MRNGKLREELKLIFGEIKVIDEDDSYIVLKKDNIGVVEIRILRGSLGSFELKFVVEKFGLRNKLFFGKNYLNTISRIKKYLEV